MAWVATTSFETTDGSTTPTDGNDLNGTGSGEGTGFSGNWIGGTGFDYDNALAQDGTWSALMGVDADQQIYRALASTIVTGHFSCYLRWDNGAADNLGIQLQSGTTRGPDLFLNFDGSGNRKPTDNSAYTGSATLPADTWTKIGIDFDCTTDTYDMYIDGTLENSGSNFLTAVSSLDRVYMRKANTAGSTNAWWDNIADGDAVAATPKKRRRFRLWW